MATRSVQADEYERDLLNITRDLPSDRIAQLIDFARYLQAKSLTEALFSDDDPASVAEQNAAWDVLLETEASQVLMDRLADEALAEYRAKRTSPLVPDDDNEINEE